MNIFFDLKKRRSNLKNLKKGNNLIFIVYDLYKNKYFFNVVFLKKKVRKFDCFFKLEDKKRKSFYSFLLQNKLIIAIFK